MITRSGNNCRLPATRQDNFDEDTTMGRLFANAVTASLLVVAAACSTGASTDEDIATSDTRTEGLVLPSPSNVPTSVPSAPPASEPAAGQLETLTEPQAPPDCRPGSNQQAGQVCTTAVFEPEITLTLPENWMPDPGNPDLPDSSSYTSDDESGYLSFTRVSEVFRYSEGDGEIRIAEAPDDLAEHLAGLPLVDSGEPQPVTVAGHEGTQVDVTIAEVPDAQPPSECDPPVEGIYLFNLAEPCEPFFIEPNVAVRFVVVASSQNGPQLVISMEASPPSERDAVFAEFDQILQSLQINEPF